jgi:hypothetical protein
LLLERGVVGVLVEFIPVADALRRHARQRQLAGEFKEACRFAHDRIEPFSVVDSAFAWDGER